MIHICNVQAINYVEYINKFNGIQRMLMDFTVTMLDCCKDMDEAELLLKTDIKLYKDSQMTLQYPRIHIAIVNKDSDFVSHDFCQVREALKNVISGREGGLSGQNVTFLAAKTQLYKSLHIHLCVCLSIINFEILLLTAFNKIAECSMMFQNVPECSRMFQNVPECSRMF